MAKVFLGIPNTGEIVAQGLMSVLNATEQNHELMVVPAGGSLLCLNFNSLWCSFLNLEEPADYFVMMHADQSVEPGWLDKLIKIIEETGADIVSCAIPIKDHRGLLSAGMCEIKDGARLHRRITLTELKQLPETFGHDDVLKVFGLGPAAHPRFMTVNTGLWIARKGEWMKEFPGFNIEDAIVQLPDGKYQPRVWPEDWNFSDWAARQGLLVRCTKAVKIEHVGVTSFPNYKVWGPPVDESGFGAMA